MSKSPTRAELLATIADLENRNREHRANIDQLVAQRDEVKRQCSQINAESGKIRQASRRDLAEYQSQVVRITHLSDANNARAQVLSDCLGLAVTALRQYADKPSWTDDGKEFKYDKGPGYELAANTLADGVLAAIMASDA